MPDKRKHRGAHPEDEHLFAESWVDALRSAVHDLSWLLSHGYAEESSLKLVGDRYDLTARQRLAVWRSACSDQALGHRGECLTTTADCRAAGLAVDGYNLLITVESALSGGVVLIGRDGAYRDLASIHGTYHKVEETIPAVELIAEFLRRAGVASIDWYLDSPVSNSGRLKALMAEVLAGRNVQWNIELVSNPDAVLVDWPGPVVTSDSWVLDRCGRWVNLAGELVEAQLPAAWRVDLRGGTAP